MRLKWMLVSVHLEILPILTQDKCTVCAEHTIGSEIILDAPDELQGDVGLGKSCFSLFGDSVCVGARYVHSLRQMYRRLKSCFGTKPMELLGDEAQVDARFGPFGDSANLDTR
jgi:hypothetical protein